MTWVADYPYDFRVALLARTRRVWLVASLIGVNIAVLAAMTFSGVDPWSPTADDVLRWGANYAPYTLAGQRWRLLTAIFVHAGALHLCMNMLVLMQIGPLVERLLGRLGFAVVYLVSGLCASVASIAWNPYAVSVGASGAIFGVFGVLVAFLVRYRRSIPPEVRRPLMRSAAIFIVLNVAPGLALKRIDIAAHMGGFVAGFVAGFIIVRPVMAGQPRAPVSRELSLLAGGLVLVAAASALVPRAFDLLAEEGAFRASDEASLEPYGEAVWKRRKNELSDADVAKVIDEQVVPPLREHQQRLVGLGRLHGEPKEWVRRTLAYIDLREQAWARLGEALRSEDRGKAKQATALHAQADKLAEALKPEHH